MKNETVEKEKQCKDCKHFYQHYGISRQLDFNKVECGHCLNTIKRNSSGIGKYRPTNKICECYEEATVEEKKAEITEKVSIKLDFLKDYVKELNDVLKLKL